MFGPITIPFGAKMLFNSVTLKPGVTFDDVELAVGQMCSVVKDTYGGDKGGFIAGQVFKFSGFVSDEGSLNTSRESAEHYVIVTYWRSFEEHEQSHANQLFRTRSPRSRRSAPTRRNWGMTCCGKARRSPSLAQPLNSPRQICHVSQ